MVTHKQTRRLNNKTERKAKLDYEKGKPVTKGAKTSNADSTDIESLKVTVGCEAL